MFTNDIKKGMRIIQTNGWQGDMWDNTKGQTRVVNVYGFETEAGSIYMKDVSAVAVDANGKPGINLPAAHGVFNGSLPDGYRWERVEMTPAQQKKAAQIDRFLGSLR